MNNQVFENYEAFYNMVLSSTVLSNNQSRELKDDATKIIDYIGKSYNLDDKLVNYCKEIIFDKLGALGLSADQVAVYSNRAYDDSFSDDDILFDIKGEVLVKINSLYDKNNKELNPLWFDYSHYKSYQSKVRFAALKTASASGDLISTRQVGIQKALGVGCEKNIKGAINTLSQCVFWGDVPSMYFLAYAYKLDGDDKNSSIFYQLAQLSKTYLPTGCTVLPKEATEGICEEAAVYYIYISTIKQDIIYPHKLYNIDFSFLEAVIFNQIDHLDRLRYINNYESRAWKNLTNSSAKPSLRVGF